MYRMPGQWQWLWVPLLALLMIFSIVPASAQAPKVVTFATNESDPESVRVFREIIAEFERKNPGIKVDLVLIPHGAEDQRLTSGVTVGADLGITQVSVRILPSAIKAGLLLPLDDMVKAIGEQDFKAGSRVHVDGKDWAMPYAGGTVALWVRTDLLKAKGLSMPQTYIELVRTAAALDARPGVYGMGHHAGPDGATSQRFAPFLYQNGCDFFDKSGNVVFDQPGCVEATRRYVALLAYSPPGYTAWSWFDGLNAYVAGRVAMTIYGGRLGVNLERANPELADRTTVVWLPTGEKVRATNAWYDYFAIPKSTKNVAEAKAFLQFLTSGDRSLRFVLTVPGHLNPPLKSVANLVLKADHPFLRRHRDWVETLFRVNELGARPEINMGAIEQGHLNPAFNPMPWSGAIFGRRPPIDSEMIQRIVVGGERIEDAHRWAADEMRKASQDWKAKNPGWTPLVVK